MFDRSGSLVLLSLNKSFLLPKWTGSNPVLLTDDRDERPLLDFWLFC